MLSVGSHVLFLLSYSRPSIAGPTIVVGIALGVQSVNKAGMEHLNDVHKVKHNSTMQLNTDAYYIS